MDQSIDTFKHVLFSVSNFNFPRITASGFLSQLEGFVDSNLVAWCTQLHNILKVSVYDDPSEVYSYRALQTRGLLRFAAALGSGGGDAQVLLFLAPHRQVDDWGWQGHACQRNLQRMEKGLTNWGSI